MKQQDITIGNVYDIKVGKNTTAVKITRAIGDGWEAKNLSSGKSLVIKSAERLLGPHQSPTSPPVAAQTPSPSQPATQSKPTNTSQPKRASALDAAVRILAEAKEPMNCRQLIEAMTEKDYWKPAHAGKTPANTLHAALSREINTKGSDARFEKVGRGQFALVCT